jgi:hypothetical protein
MMQRNANWSSVWGVYTPSNCSELKMDHEAQIYSGRHRFFHIENRYSVHSLIRCLTRMERGPALA